VKGVEKELSVVDGIAVETVVGSVAMPDFDFVGIVGFGTVGTVGFGIVGIVDLGFVIETIDSDSVVGTVDSHFVIEIAGLDSEIGIECSAVVAGTVAQTAAGTAELGQQSPVETAVAEIERLVVDWIALHLGSNRTVHAAEMEQGVEMAYVVVHAQIIVHVVVVA
jgi:hypothetical protein